LALVCVSGNASPALKHQVAGIDERLKAVALQDQ
jgi:hypothetical protein